LAETLFRFVGWLLLAILAGLLEAFIFSAFPKRGQTFQAWWSGKSILAKLITCLSWLFWMLVVLGLATGFVVGLIEKRKVFEGSLDVFA
jgi:predicted permease